MINDPSAASREMPRYQCHKIVRALEIGSVSGLTIAPADGRFAPFNVNPSLFLRYQPKPGDFYVVYETDGYASVSPRASFLDGYSLICGDEPAAPAAEPRHPAVAASYHLDNEGHKL